MGWLGIPVIIPYRGYGNRLSLYISGTVSEDKGLAKPIEEHSIWENMRAMIKRFISDEIPGVRVKATFMGKQMTGITNERGFFHFKFDLIGMEIPDLNWQFVELELLDFIIPLQKKTTATGEVLILKENEKQFGVISDIDDTVLVSHATNSIKKTRLMLFKNAITRLPFEGVAGFYNALSRGKGDNNQNPIFYVSSSQWNVYDLLLDFCRHRNIPDGPFLLQHFHPLKLKHLFKGKNQLDKHVHKIKKIRHLLTTFDFLNFILIGDSGQKDAEIYKSICFEFPGRILAIYIRDIKKSKAKKVTLIGKQLNHVGVEMLLIKDTLLAAKHAVDKGFINEDALIEVVYERELDHSAAIVI
ncbi:MAG: DUF2183 domain-containing protein [Bacteroidetes bacterium]|nr:DUF2183 domain-containing protein [Bacteroidota bacterium]